MPSLIPRPREEIVGDGVVEIPDRNVTTSIDPALAPEGYTLNINKDGVRITGGSPAGIFYGTQTFNQLLPPSSFRGGASGPWQVPVLCITDSPRFKWRGVMLDVARHFVPLHNVLRFIHLASMHKFNVVHLHLTDDQGWRIALPGWPRLSTVGAWRKRSMRGAIKHGLFDNRPHGGFYTADDLREMAGFAAARHVTIVPEVDMPGHMQAAVAAYPELGNGKEEVSVMEAWGISKHILNVEDATLDFCRTVLDFLCDIFPGTYIGIGGDECPHDEWQASPQAQQRMKDLGLKDETALHGWFVEQMATHLRKRGRRAFGWDEIMAADGIPSDVLIAGWRGRRPTFEAARRGFDVVSCPDVHVYLDYRQSDDEGEPTPIGLALTLKRIYGFEPVPADLTDEEKKRVIGAQANIWTEHMDNPQHVEYMSYPRLCAFAEVVWGKPLSQAGRTAFEDFSERIKEHLHRLDAMAVNYRPLSGPRPWDARPDKPGDPRARKVRAGDIAEILTGLDIE